MPSLGNFLKKKRTREDKGDHHHSHGQPTSPVATSHQPQATTAGGGAAAPAASANANAPTNNLNPPHVTVNQPSPGTTATTTATSAEQPTQQPHPHHQDPNNVNSSTTANSNNLNLANASAPQHDGAAPVANLNTSPFSQNQSSSSLGPAIVPTTSASPGTDPALLQKQQQAALPPPSTNPPAPASPVDNTIMHVDSPAQQQQQHGQVQQQPQQQQIQTQSSSGHQHNASTSSTARVTKGKYTLNDFDILRTLGTGSFGRVHLVQSKHNQRFYAIKVLKKAQVVKMKQVEHTNDERRMLSDVKHPFLITLWGTFQDWKSLYMVMDFVEGGELFSLLRKSGRFPNPVAKFYAAEVTLALEYMHSKNIIYRDLKPENLLLDRHGHLKITDFGFAKRVPDKTWTLCGTPDYLAPEVVSNKGYNKSVDWWSLGILIYEMLCGYTPFWDSGSPMRIYENILKGKVKYPAYIAPEAQDLLQKLITADLTKRLGNLYGGSTDVKNHPWFQEVTWDRLARKDIDAPYTPPVKAGAGDASQFDKYPEEAEKYGSQGGNDEYGHLFTEF